MRACCASTGNLITTSASSPGTGVDITPVCKSSCTRCFSAACQFEYGIEKYTLTYIVDLSSAPKSCCKVDVSWEQCCRNSAITTGLANDNFYAEVTLDRCVKPCDNSPKFTESPIAILCVGQDFIYNQGVVDKDVDSNGQLLDSLVFNFTKPLVGRNNPGSYSGNYTYKKPINYLGFPRSFKNPPRGIHLDPLTGDLQFRPMKKEQTVMTFSIKEYRNGKYIGEVRRDMQVIVVNCPKNKPPTISGINGSSKFRTSVCAGETVKFNVYTSDRDRKDTVRIGFNPGNLPGNPQWSDNNGKVKHPTGTFKWKTKQSYVSNLPYTFTVTQKTMLAR